MDRSGGRSTPTDKSTNKTQGKKDTPRAPYATHRMSDMKKTSRLSAPMLSKVEIDIEPRRASAGSNLSKSKSCSMHSLTFAEAELELTPRGTNKKPRSKWAKSTGNLSSFASVPNLLQPDDDGKLSVKSDDSSSVASAKTDPDINDNVFKDPKLSTRRSSQTNVKSDSSGSLANSRRSASTSRLNSDSSDKEGVVVGGTLDRKRTKRTGTTSASNLQSVKSKDRDLMPPPSIPSLKTTRQERIAKRANDSRRKTTDNSGFSLEEAKEILSGKSTKITEIKESARKKRSTSTSPNRAKGKNGTSVANEITEQSDFHSIPSGVLDASAEIELTAAELRRKSAQTNQVSMEASPNDPPERDIPTKSRANKSATGVHKTHINAKVQPLVNNSEISDSSRDSGLSTQEDEECPSPSVKDRIARLNKQVNDERQASSSPSRAGFRSNSPSFDVSRHPESVQNSLSSTKTIISINASTNDPVLATDNTSVTFSTSTKLATSQLNNTNTFQSNSVPDSYSEIPAKPMTPVNPGVHGSMISSTQSLSPPSGLGTSMDSDILASNLSPGNHSNSSPRSVADTGLGSDTDLETRYDTLL